MQKQSYFLFQKKISFELIESLYNSNSKFLWMDSYLKKEKFLSYLFYKPITWIECRTQKDLEPKLKELQFALQEGYHLAGFFSYEFGKALQNLTKQDPEFPYFQFGVYETPLVFSKLEIPKKTRNFQISNFETSINWSEYSEKIEKIRALIQEGKVYQINYTFFLKFRFLGSALDFYLALREAQRTDYSAFVNYEFPILSLSPELFFEIKHTQIQTKPMKGTFVNSLNLQEEQKNKAENFMITDLLRNDIGRISQIGSVVVKNLFKEESYTFLKQFTSTVKGKFKANLSMFEFCQALFPGGSITGAPKREATKHISYLENENREIYTGSIGYFSPKKKALFNIAIRTIQLTSIQGKMGIGSGIVFDSTAQKEWEECFIKARFLLNTLGFAIFETLLLKNGRFILKQAHLDRLCKTCNFFQYPLDEDFFQRELLKLETQFFKGKFKVRWIVNNQGNFKYEISEISSLSVFPKKILLSKKRTNSKNIFLYYKTSQREFYNLEYQNLDKTIFADKIFLNEKQELTEGCITNIFVLIRDIYYTPPKTCGLLEGTFRNYLLKKFPKIFQERVLTQEDLLESKKVFLCNSVRGILKVEEVVLEK